MSKVKSLQALCDELHRKYAGLNKDIIEIDDFSYIDGHPIVLSWGEGTKLHIGKFCSIAANVTFMLGGDHRNDWCSTYPFNVWLKHEYGDIKGHPQSKGDIWIGNDVWISRDSKIMSGVRIGDGATVAGNAVVTKDVPAYTVVGGVPAKVLKYRFPPRETRLLKTMEWWNWPLEHIAEVVPLLQSRDVQSLIDYYERWQNDGYHDRSHQEP